MKQKHFSRGFTVAEVVVTLFVAAGFLGLGYQIFTAIERNGGQDRQRAKADNIAYDYLRRQTVSSCSSLGTPAFSTIASTNTGNDIVSKRLTPLYGCSGSLVKVEIQVTYGTASPQQSVTHALYVKASS